MNEYNPDEVSSPGETIKELLENRGWTEEDFVKCMGLPQEDILKLLQGEYEITPGVAVRLSQVLGPSTVFWLNLEANYRKFKGPSDSKLLNDLLMRLYAGYQGSFQECWDEVCEALGVDGEQRGLAKVIAENSWLSFTQER